MITAVLAGGVLAAASVGTIGQDEPTAAIQIAKLSFELVCGIGESLVRLTRFAERRKLGATAAS
jgi:hypothetical protein